MNKTIGSLIDELSITNNKLFYLVDKGQKGEGTGKDFKKVQDLNSYRTKLINEINKFFPDQEEIIKV